MCAKNKKVNEMLAVRKNNLLNIQLILETDYRNYINNLFTDAGLIFILSSTYRIMLVISLIFLFSY